MHNYIHDADLGCGRIGAWEGKVFFGNIPPAQVASSVVPFKDWNDVVIPEGVADMDYKVSLYRRKSVKGKSPVFDATLTPFEAVTKEDSNE